MAGRFSDLAVASTNHRKTQASSAASGGAYVLRRLTPSQTAKVQVRQSENATYLPFELVLLRHRNGLAGAVLRGALQQGHRARVVARATIRCRRIVAIEFATCRSGRTGGASGWAISGNLRRREFIGGSAGR